ncbi:histidine kinase [Leptolyngbya valderiana BDU 20041]|nr:ATP-binding protein [Geitlerinema sp. CS-897]OAB61888.1 histidine kinase [Leptolyngbya valderiana BDU 20041]PPT06532.1 Phosphate regulon sensor protein PhoR (SphS) [Geitlerinema sp. FC II]
MSAVVAFILGLAVGFGIGLWHLAVRHRQWTRVLRDLSPDVSSVRLAPASQMRLALTQMSQRQEELAADLTLLQHMLQQAPWGYLQVDAENHLVRCNPQARSLLKIQQWSPQSERVLLEVVRSYELDRLIERTRTDNFPLQIEWLFYAPSFDADEIDNQRGQTLRAYSLPPIDGQVGVFIENRQPIVESMQSRNRWMSDLAHELRTPLTSIQLVVETLVDRLEPPMKSWVERLLPETKRLIQLVQDWLELTHLEANRSLHTEPIALQPLIESVWRTLEPLAGRKQVRLSYREPEALYVEGDESRLYRVFLNLLDNAVRYSRQDSVVRVEAEIIGDDRVRVHTIDSGSGFDPEDLPHIFDRLYRGDLGRGRTTPTNNAETLPVTSSGSGLGLAIVKQIVLAHGGAIAAKNHPETGGAWLQVSLPRAEPSEL